MAGALAIGSSSLSQGTIDGTSTSPVPQGSRSKHSTYLGGTVTLDLQGSTTIATSDSLYVGQGAQAVNTGTLTLDSSSILYGQCGQAATA